MLLIGFLSVSDCLPVCLSLCASVPDCFCVYLPLSFSLSISFSLSLSLSLSHSPPPSPLSLYLSIFLFIISLSSLYLFLHLSNFHFFLSRSSCLYISSPLFQPQSLLLILPPPPPPPLSLPRPFPSSLYFFLRLYLKKFSRPAIFCVEENLISNNRTQLQWQSNKDILKIKFILIGVWISYLGEINLSSL